MMRTYLVPRVKVSREVNKRAKNLTNARDTLVFGLSWHHTSRLGFVFLISPPSFRSTSSSFHSEAERPDGLWSEALPSLPEEERKPTDVLFNFSNASIWKANGALRAVAKYVLFGNGGVTSVTKTTGTTDTILTRRPNYC